MILTRTLASHSNFLQKNLEPPLSCSFLPVLATGSRLKILPLRLRDCSKSRTLCHNFRVRFYKKEVKCIWMSADSSVFAPCRIAAVHFLLSKVWSYLIHIGGLFPFLSSSLMRRLAQVYKSLKRGNRKTYNTSTICTGANVLCLFSIYKPISLRINSVNWMNSWWHHLRWHLWLEFCFGDG